MIKGCIFIFYQWTMCAFYVILWARASLCQAMSGNELILINFIVVTNSFYHRPLSIIILINFDEMGSNLKLIKNTGFKKWIEHTRLVLLVMELLSLNLTLLMCIILHWHTSNGPVTTDFIQCPDILNLQLEWIHPD